MSNADRKPNFVTLYLPQDKTIRDIFWKIAHSDISVSGQILKILAWDLLKKGLITAEENVSVQTFSFHKTTKVASSSKNYNYSWYIPKDLRWVLDRIDANLHGKVPFRSRSRYVWSVFMQHFAPDTATQYMDNQKSVA